MSRGRGREHCGTEDTVEMWRWSCLPRLYHELKPLHLWPAMSAKLCRRLAGSTQDIILQNNPLILTSRESQKILVHRDHLFLQVRCAQAANQSGWVHATTLCCPTPGTPRVQRVVLRDRAAPSSIPLRLSSMFGHGISDVFAVVTSVRLKCRGEWQVWVR